jgi:hypothetical protein
MKTFLIAVFAFALSHAAWGQLITFNTTLNGLQETPPTPSPALGTGSATFDLNSRLFTLNFAFTGLVAPETEAHIHVGAPGMPGPILFPLPLGTPVTFTTTLTSTQESQLLSDLWYVNVHSTVFPAGEIRGQLIAVPEPSTYAIAGAGLLGFLLVGRSWRRRPTVAAEPEVSTV